MADTPKIEDAVGEKIDKKIDAAKIPRSLDTAENIASKTTVEEDLKTRGQRNINLIWETTQAMIAIAITISVIYCDVMLIKTENLGKAFVLIIAIYFVRMNHIKIGGVGGTDTR